jgi:hypothetical protein
MVLEIPFYWWKSSDPLSSSIYCCKFWLLSLFLMQRQIFGQNINKKIGAWESFAANPRESVNSLTIELGLILVACFEVGRLVAANSRELL